MALLYGLGLTATIEQVEDSEHQAGNADGEPAGELNEVEHVIPFGAEGSTDWPT